MDESLNGGTEGETLTAMGHEPEADLKEDGSTGTSMLTRDDVPGAENHAPELEADGNEGQGK
ncbi:MAG: hypothetical protein IJD04_03650, partial [Desulfovibrionaceae bacterium]|nr:hypothetical protein [Desulfovibrionaceae bacterium]